MGEGVGRAEELGCHSAPPPPPRGNAKPWPGHVASYHVVLCGAGCSVPPHADTSWPFGGGALVNARSWGPWRTGVSGRRGNVGHTVREPQHPPCGCRCAAGGAGVRAVVSALHGSVRRRKCRVVLCIASRGRPLVASCRVWVRGSRRKRHVLGLVVMVARSMAAICPPGALNHNAPRRRLPSFYHMGAHCALCARCAKGSPPPPYYHAPK